MLFDAVHDLVLVERPQPADVLSRLFSVADFIRTTHTPHSRGERRQKEVGLLPEKETLRSLGRRQSLMCYLARSRLSRKSRSNNSSFEIPASQP